MSVFQELFSTARARNARLQIEPIAIGQRFPFPEETEGLNKPCIVIFIFLNCASCIELLNELEQFAQANDRQLQLYIADGSAEEVQELKDYYDFSFPVLNVTPSVRRDVYGINLTPFIYVVDSEGVIAASGKIRNTEGIWNLLGHSQEG